METKRIHLRTASPIVIASEVPKIVAFVKHFYNTLWVTHSIEFGIFLGRQESLRTNNFFEVGTDHGAENSVEQNSENDFHFDV